MFSRRLIFAACLILTTFFNFVIVAKAIDKVELPEFRIQKGKTQTFTIAAWKGNNAVIDFYSRIDEKSQSQKESFHALAIKINGNLVRSRYEGNYMANSWDGRLINRPFFMAGEDGRRRGTFHWKFYWNVFRSKTFEPYKGSLNGCDTAEERSQMYHLVIDVSDFLKADSNNLIEFNANRAWDYEADMVIKDFHIREFSDKERYRKDSNLEKPLGPVERGVFTDYSRVPHEVTVCKDGTISVKTGKNTYLLESIISYPGRLGNGLIQDQNIIVPEKKLGHYYRKKRAITNM